MLNKINDDKLKPCPFCECDFDLRAYQDEYTRMYQATCCLCGATGPLGHTEFKAIAAWNKRQGEIDGEG